mgnify:CR=1 FL=1
MENWRGIKPDIASFGETDRCSAEAYDALNLVDGDPAISVGSRCNEQRRVGGWYIIDMNP